MIETRVWGRIQANLFVASDAPAREGTYRHEIKAATAQAVAQRNRAGHGRDDAGHSGVAVPFATAGTFVVERGVIIIPDDTLEETAESK